MGARRESDLPLKLQGSSSVVLNATRLMSAPGRHTRWSDRASKCPDRLFPRVLQNGFVRVGRFGLFSSETDQSVATEWIGEAEAAPPFSDTRPRLATARLES
ncbi:hypothetical protein MPC4_250052 [Methylocella tundrae]|uniref:Uncharacterized protein n=1 Tax=Methylocella tundrae TaxID=227605 RepID=A0A8B6M931_METTU|nr:hypothetical protein MPC4_250052 [Methylocella tundrae]